MLDRFMRIWRKLNTATIGSDRYWSISLLNAAFYKDMMPFIADYAYGRCLDIGAGRLAWKNSLSPHVESYISGDVVLEDSRIDVVLDISGRLPFADESFDTVFCCSVLEHVPRPWEALSEVSRILSPGGTLIISLPFILHLHDLPHDYYRFSIYGAEYLLHEAGFEIKKVAINGGFFHLVLNPVSIAFSVAFEALRLHSLVPIFNRLWLALAEKLDSLFGLKDVYASNHIFTLKKPVI
jgi:SAM-dependent methyltransferase